SALRGRCQDSGARRPMDVLVDRRAGSCNRHARLGGADQAQGVQSADAHRQIERYLPVLDKQLEGRDYVVGPLTLVDFLIGPRLDTAPAILKFETSGYANIGAWQERLKAKPYWSTA